MMFMLVWFFLMFLPLARAEFLFSKCSHNTSTFDLRNVYVFDQQSFLNDHPAGSSRYQYGNRKIPLPDGSYTESLYQCRLDVSRMECYRCVSSASNMSHQLCRHSKNIGFWYSECFFRYVDGYQSGFPDIKYEKRSVSKNLTVINERPKFFRFVRQVLEQSVSELHKYPRNLVGKETYTYNNFSQTKWIYSLVQCTEDLSSLDCSYCINKALSYLNYFNETQAGWLYLASCYFRFDVKSFFDFNALPVPSPPIKAHRRSIAGVVTAVVILVLFGIGSALVIKYRQAPPTPHVAAAFESDQATTADSFSFSPPKAREFALATIRAATGDFSQMNKLGNGGHGSVFKGMLEDSDTADNEKEIAVKRSSGSSSLGTSEFKKEVAVAANLQHPNIVKLLGFCVEEDENILVYELVPNRSLDYILFDSERKATLSWTERLKIVEGVARGLHYLHEGSKPKVTHRDLKASNVLLDGNMNPKIANSGTTRTFNALGYMAPEYAMHGLFSSKSDVYSYGVLVLEVITGKKSIGSEDRDDFLLPYVWKHWTAQDVMSVRDLSFGEQYNEREVSRCVQIGLLCAQEDPQDRPTMASVLRMLSSNSETMESPGPPWFFQGMGFRQN